MLSIEEVKKIIDDPTITDKEIKVIRDECYILSEIIYEMWIIERGNKCIKQENILE